MDYLKLTEQKLDINRINELVSDESCGAISLFVGTTRDNFEGKAVVKLEYEAYESMAKKTMSELCTEIRQQWPDVKNIAIYHRLGLVPVKEASVVIAISSPHRRSSLDAVSYTIEQLKKSVPIWKKEIYKDPGAGSEWKENKESITGDVEDKNPHKKLKKLNFEDCKVVNQTKISKDLVQIKVDEDEIARRINKFIENKREEINRSNIQDFIETKSEDVSCARVNSVVFRIKDSKGHLKVRRVKNEYGPQDDKNYKSALDKLMDKQETSTPNPPNQIATDSINERLENAEKFLKLESSAKKNIFERIKLIENKILYLESVSPEYSKYLEHPGQKNNGKKAEESKRNSYTVLSIDEIIKELEAKKRKL